MVGRPKKGSNPKKVELTAEQKRYSAIIKEVADLSELKQKRIDVLQEKVKKINEEMTTLQNEVNNLKGIRTSAENILASKPAPPEWEKFNKCVYEYHYHYYPNTPYYIYPWWTYTNGGTLQYPTWQTITTPWTNGYTYYNAQSGNLGLSNGQSGSYTFTTAGALPIAPVVTNSLNLNCSNSLSLASSSFNNVVLTGNGSIPSFVDAIAGSGSTVFCSSIAADVPGTATTGYVAYTPTDEQVAESEQFLTSIGFTATITQ